jgi:hypothetical protein
MLYVKLIHFDAFFLLELPIRVEARKVKMAFKHVLLCMPLSVCVFQLAFLFGQVFQPALQNTYSAKCGKGSLCSPHISNPVEINITSGTNGILLLLI